MARFVVLALLSIVAAATTTASVTIKEKALAPFGIVEGAISCGSKAQVLQVRVTDCTTLPCDFHMGKTYFFEIDFISVANHPLLTVTISIINGGVEETVVQHDVVGAIAAGGGYTVAYPLTITGSFGQGSVAARIELSEGGITEVCLFATGIIHQ